MHSRNGRSATAIHALLDNSNLVFRQILVVADMLAGGYLTTALHWSFVTLPVLAVSTYGAHAVPSGTKPEQRMSPA